MCAACQRQPLEPVVTYWGDAYCPPCHELIVGLFDENDCWPIPWTDDEWCWLAGEGVECAVCHRQPVEPVVAYWGSEYCPSCAGVIVEYLDDRDTWPAVSWTDAERVLVGPEPRPS